MFHHANAHRTPFLFSHREPPSADRTWLLAAIAVAAAAWILPFVYEHVNRPVASERATPSPAAARALPSAPPATAASRAAPVQRTLAPRRAVAKGSPVDPRRAGVLGALAAIAAEGEGGGAPAMLGIAPEPGAVGAAMREAGALALSSGAEAGLRHGSERPGAIGLGALTTDGAGAVDLGAKPSPEVALDGGAGLAAMALPAATAGPS